MNQFEDIAIVIPSCDKYSDLWRPLFENLRCQWPNNPLKIYLISNHADFVSEGVSVIKIGDDITWSYNLKKALTYIPENTIFLLIDDLFFKKPVDTVRLYRLFSRFQTEKMNYLRFNPTPGPVGTLDADGIGFVPRGDYYRSSTVVCLWKKQILSDVLCDEESAWEFELIGSARTDQFGAWYASGQWLLPTYNLVIKGKIDPISYWILNKKGLSLSDKRPLMRFAEFLRFQVIRLRSWLFTFVPRDFRRSIRDKFVKNKNFGFR